MTEVKYDEFIRTRITELRIKKDVSEHKMSLDLDKSGSYIRGITNGAALPSLKELFNIIAYFEMTPSEFFVPLDNKDTPYHRLCDRLHDLSDEEIEKINTFVDWIQK